jgi:hypothetical protein
MYAIQAPHQAHTSMFRLWSDYYEFRSDCSSRNLSLEYTSRGLCILIHRISPSFPNTCKHASFQDLGFRCHTGNSIRCKHYPKIKLTWIEAYSAMFLSEYGFSLGLISFDGKYHLIHRHLHPFPLICKQTSFMNFNCRAYSVFSCEGKFISLGFVSF